ncbi:hypothetical protein J2W23_001616 [Variovorax boronicumulans]|nr:hypothetical protein [Variovorax boronicumulans]
MKRSRQDFNPKPRLELVGIAAEKLNLSYGVHFLLSE